MGTLFDVRPSVRIGSWKRYRTAVLSLAFVAVTLTGAVAGVAAFGAGATSGPLPASIQGSNQSGATEIGSCTVIDEPGRYELTEDVRGSGDTCIHVKASDVVVDGNGHTVGAANHSNVSAGVLVHNGSASDIEQDVEELANVTVRDLRVTGWTNGVRTGEFVSDGPTVTIENVTAVDNEGGFVLYGAGESSLTNVTATENRVSGVFIWESSSVDVDDLTVSDNGGNGLVLDQSVLTSNFTDVTATGNGGHGVLVGTSAVDNRFVDAYVAGNGEAGVHLSDSAGTYVRNATIENNDGPGVLSTFGDADRVENVTVRNNGVAYDSRDDQPRYGVVADEFRLGTGVVASFGTNVTRFDDAADVPELPSDTCVAGPAANVTTSEGDASARATLTFPLDEGCDADVSDVAVWQHVDGDWRVVSDSTTDDDGETVTATVHRSGVVVPVVGGGEPASDGSTPDGSPSGGSTFVVNSTGDGEDFAYAFAVVGSVEPADVETLAVDDEEHIEERSGGLTFVVGTSGDGEGDTFSVDGEIVKFALFPEDPSVSLELDGANVTDRLLDDEAE